MKKIFILAGELSGDKLGAWYLNKLKKNEEKFDCEAVGGDFLQIAGARIYQRFEKLNIAGFVEIIKRLRFIFKFLNSTLDYILQNNFDEVILVDFPGFNLRLAKKLKRKNPNIKITYLSPPQLWAWGAFRARTLKKNCDDIIVLFPFEVDWYEKRGIKVRYLGNPVYDELQSSFDNAVKEKNRLVILPGSRTSEIEKLLPIFIESIKKFRLINSGIDIYLPLAESINIEKIKTKLRRLRAPQINIVLGQKEKLKILNSATLALSKPGTISLLLSFLRVPSLMVYKTSWVTYFLAKLLARIKYMSLPNLFLNKIVFKEIIQVGCNPKNISKNLNILHKSCLRKDDDYQKLQKDFDKVRGLFS